MERINEQLNSKHIPPKASLAPRDWKSEGMKFNVVKLEFEIPARWIFIRSGIMEFFHYHPEA